MLFLKHAFRRVWPPVIGRLWIRGKSYARSLSPGSGGYWFERSLSPGSGGYWFVISLSPGSGGYWFEMVGPTGRDARGVAACESPAASSKADIVIDRRDSFFMAPLRYILRVL